MAGQTAATKNKYEGDNYKIIATGSFAFVFGTGLLILAFCEGEPADHATTLLICLTGCILGWVFGITSSPYNKKDGEDLNKFTKLIGTFLSGYILAKMDKLLEKFLSYENVKESITDLSGIRLLFFISFFFLTWVVVFVYRQYATGEMPKEVKVPK